jgi:hypothetical protein
LERYKGDAMNLANRVTAVLVIILLAFGLFPGWRQAEAAEPFLPGNTDINILNGGIMLTCGEDFYYSGNEIYLQRGDKTSLISAEDGKNLNLAGEYIYYTLEGGEVHRVNRYGGKPELVYAHGKEITQLYVIGEDCLLFLSEGRAWRYVLTAGKLSRCSNLEGVSGLIPTEYGNIYLTGGIFDYTLYAGNKRVLEHVTSCYTDEGHLALWLDGENYQVKLSRLFGGFDLSRDLEPFNIHGSVNTVTLFGLEGETHTCDVCEANAADFSASLMTAGVDAPEDAAFVSPALSQGQINIVKRARQLHEVEWTPLEDRWQWDYMGVFKAGTTYTGVPYGQPIYTGYVGYYISVSDFVESVNNNSSKFYTTYSQYNKIAPAYSCDCSGFVSYAWGLPVRRTTYTLVDVAQKVSDQSIYSLQVGDCLNKRVSHVGLVSDVGYDDSGNIISVEIMEQTTPSTRLTRYGAGGTKTLAQLQSDYLNDGYVIYRYSNRDNVSYAHDCAVPIDGDYCGNCKAPAPTALTIGFIGGKTIVLSHKDPGAEIYYTTDGSTPTKNSTRYTGPITVTSDTRIRAFAVTPQFSSSRVMDYTVKIPNAEMPAAEVTKGLYDGNVVSQGSEVTLSTPTSGAEIYYTLDGSAPTTNSTKYTSPIVIDKDTTIKAVAFAPGMKESRVAVLAYKVGKIYTITASAGFGGRISPSGSVSILQSTSKTFAITPGNGYAVKDVKVNGVSVGAVTSYTFSNVNANQSITAEFRDTIDLPFNDVSADSWYHTAVCYAYRNSLFNGTSKTEFSPDGNMTRGMFVTVLGRMAGVPAELTGNVGVVNGNDVRIREEPNTDSNILSLCSKYTALQVLGSEGGWYKVQHGEITGYIRGDLLLVYDGQLSDLKEGQYYTGYVQWAYLCGILSGVADNTFNADQDITREEMALILYNYAAGHGVKIPSVKPRETFKDHGEISGVARKAVYAFQQAGIINGMGNGEFKPRSTATRAQVAQIYMNAAETLKKP